MKAVKKEEVVTASSAKNKYSGKFIGETIINGFFTVDRNWIVQYWNKGAETLLDMPSKQIVNKNIWQAFADIIPLEFYAVYHKAFLHDIPVHFQEYWGELGVWFDVVTFYCDDTLSVSFKTNDRHFRSTRAEEFISEDQEWKNLSQLYRIITEVTNDCLWEWELKSGEIFWIDGGHKRVFGYEIENTLIPQTFWESRIHPGDKLRILNRLSKVLKAGKAEIWEIEYRFQKADGNYAYVHDRGHILYDEEGKPSRMIGATQDISETVLLARQVVAGKEKKHKTIVEAVLLGQEQERAAIGKELHDNLNQVLAVTKLYIQLAHTSDNKSKKYLDKSIGLITSVIEEIRAISKNLVVPGSEIISLVGNIENLISDYTELHALDIHFFEKRFNEEGLSDSLRLNIFRIIQEQFQNIVRHSGAAHVNLSLSRSNGKIYLLMSDDGKGCKITDCNEGLGMINMRSRVEMFNGTLTVHSSAGKGYQLEACFISDEQAAPCEL